jgi:hypothetical protein
MITAPANGASLASPFPFAGNTSGVPNVDHTRILLDGTSSIYYGGVVPYANKWIFAPTGQHNLTLAAYGKNDKSIASTTIAINVSSETTPAVLSQLQSIAAWDWCTASLLGLPCASGLGQATSAQVIGQSSPSDGGGTATLFTIGGTHPYSNALWWISLGGGTLLSHFTYDLDFYIDNAAAPEALEFDVNQSFGGTRYTWGTECSYKNTRAWNVWNPQAGEWVTTSAPCPQVTSNQWHHLEWQFERINNQVHYISVSVDNNTLPVDLYLNPQPNWNKEDIDVAFQMDGDYQQTPYRVWLDNVNLTASY